MLTDASNVVQSDFYSYRYFASEGFLPGYNFPRLPLSAFIPARKPVQGRDEFLSRPRFLAITEFRIRSIIYHEGSPYIVNKVILPVADGDGAITQSAKQCRSCGYIQELAAGEAGDDLCPSCSQRNLQRLDSLLRLRERGDRAAQPDHQRRRGTDPPRLRDPLRASVQERFGVLDCRTGQVIEDDHPVFKLVYGDARPLADQPGLAAAKQQGSLRLRPGPRARLLAILRPATG